MLPRLRAGNIDVTVALMRPAQRHVVDRLYQGALILTVVWVLDGAQACVGIHKPPFMFHLIGGYFLLLPVVSAAALVVAGVLTFWWDR